MGRAARRGPARLRGRRQAAPKPLISRRLTIWLGRLLATMQASVNGVVRSAAADCESMRLDEFVWKYQAQVSLIGIQIKWTMDVEDALFRAKTEMNFAKCLKIANLLEAKGKTPDRAKCVTKYDDGTAKAKTKFVNDKMMAKWKGRYKELYSKSSSMQPDLILSFWMDP